MSMRPFSIREQQIFVVLVLVCGLYAAFAFIYRPSVEKTEAIEREITLARKKWAEQTTVIQKEKIMARAWQEKFDAVRQKGSNEEAMSAMLSEIEVLSGSMNIRVTEMKPQGAVKGEFYNTFSISLSVDGDLKDILAFVHVLQDPSRHLKVRQFSLERTFADAKGMIARVVMERTLFP